MRILLPARAPITPAHNLPRPSAGRTATTDSHHETLLIFPFENDSKIANLDWMGEGLSELTAERLEDRQVNVLSREDRLASLERMGLPDSARFSHATIIKIAGGSRRRYGGVWSISIRRQDGHARSARAAPQSAVSIAAAAETGSMQDLLRAHARLTWQILCALDQKQCPAQGTNRDESSFSDPPPSLTSRRSGEFRARP